ncbi:MAG: hypothetical protein ACLGHQ_11090 [Acidimicrobiia bacterium]
MSDGETTQTEQVARPRPARPNYAARRMLVTTIGITALVAAGVAAWSVLRGDDGDASSPETEWDEIALIDRATGSVARFDDAGEPIATTAGSGRVSTVHAHAGRLALVGATTIVLTDGTEDDEPTTIEIPRRSIVTPVETASTMHLLVGSSAGGNLSIVDVADGSVIDVGAAAAPTVPKLFVETVQVAADGSRFAVADAANFQTIVVGDDIDGAAFLADQPVAVGEDLIATSQVVNLQADISLVDLERRTEAVVPTELPRGGVMVGDDLVMVSVDGGVFRIGPGDREAERIGAVTVPAGGAVSWAQPSWFGERLVVGGAGFAAVVDLDGTNLFSTTFASSTEQLRPRPTWRCLPVGGETGHSIVDLETGEQLADLTGLAVESLSADGCTVVGDRDGTYELVDRAGRVELGTPRRVALAPDGDAVVWTTTEGRTELVPIDDDLTLGDPVELVDAPTNGFVTFLRR